MGTSFMQQISNLPRQPQYAPHGARMPIPVEFVGIGRGRGRDGSAAGAGGGRVPVYLGLGGKGNMKRAYWCPARHVLFESLRLFRSDNKIALQQAEWMAADGFSQVLNLCNTKTGDETAKFIADEFPAMHGTQKFVLARYGPADLGYSPMEARHIKSFRDGSDGFAKYFPGVIWPTLFPANFNNECFSFQPLDSELKFVNDFNATTRNIASALYPGTEDESHLYLPFPAGYIGPVHPDYLEPDVICHLCEAPVYFQPRMMNTLANVSCATMATVA